MKKTLPVIVALILAFSLACSAFAANLPSSYSSVDKGYVTPVKSQGYSGACVAFSAISCVESDYIMKGYGTKDNTDFSEAYLYWFAINSYIDNESLGIYGDGIDRSYVEDKFSIGLEDRDVISAFKNDSGIAYENEFPFDVSPALNIGYYSEARRFGSGCNVRVKDCVVFDKNDQSAIKSWIMNHGSVTVGYYSGFYFEGTNGTVAVSNLALAPNHSVAIVGWDDNFTAQGSGASLAMKGKGAWLCKNSWTENWGDSGYFWLPYSAKSIDRMVGYSVVVDDSCTDRLSYNGYAFYTDNTDAVHTVANHFTADVSGTVSTVSFYTFAGNDVTLTLYKDNGDKIPDSGEKISSVTVHEDEEGFYTVSLGSSYSVQKGEKLWITANYSDRPPLEYAYGSDRIDESYVYYNGGWDDLGENDNYGNAPLDIIIAGTHNYTDTFSAEPTCSTDGYTIKVCEHCGKSIRTTTPASGHDFGAWETVVETSDKVPGLYARTCGKCGYTEFKTVDSQGNEGRVDSYEDYVSFYYADSSPALSFFNSISEFFVNIGNLISAFFRTGIVNLINLVL